MDYSLPGSSVHRVFQARTLEWVAITTPGDLPNPGKESALQVDPLSSEPSPEELLKVAMTSFCPKFPEFVVFAELAQCFYWDCARGMR